MTSHHLASLAAASVAALLAACAHAPAPTPPLQLPADWDGATSLETAASASAAPWWGRAGDPAIDAFMAAAEAGHPTLAAVLARVDEARADAGLAAAAGSPSLGLQVSAQRARSAGDIGEPAATAGSHSAGAIFRWELDVAGRIRASTEAARQRLAAREADAVHARLLLQHQVVAATLGLRACRAAEALHGDAVVSRRQSIEGLRGRWKAGLAPLVDVQREASLLALAEVDLAHQQEACIRLVHQVAALTALPPAQVRAQMAPATPAAAWPGAVLPRPATVLLAHPSVEAAVREMNAAWSDISAARAMRWPTVSLEAQLSRTWLRAGGAGQAFTPWSLAPSLLAPLFDGGAGAARVSAAEARYRGAVAQVELTVRQALTDVENALAAVDHAQRRAIASAASLDAAQVVWRAAEARFEAGAIAPLDREDARRQFLTARLAAVAAARDRGLAWATLVGASGDAAWLNGAAA